jgi:hypothetical protein
MNGDTTTAARFDNLGSGGGAMANFVFVSSATFPGNLGSAAMYQAQCNKLATAAGINNAAGNAYIAWIAASNYAPLSLLGSSRSWLRADLLPWIDDMPTALSKGNVYYPVAYDENGQRVYDTTLAGMNQTGTYYAGNNCNDWTDGTLNAGHGHTHAGGRSWAYNNVGVSSCANSNRIICLSTGAGIALAVSPAAGKKIFLSKTGWVPGGGVSAADAKCMTDKPASVTTAKAILLASTRAFTDVLAPATTYVRPDGVAVGTGADIVSALNGKVPATIEATPTQDGGGTYVDTSVAQLVWTGVTRTGSAGQDTCNDWTSSTSASNGTAGSVASGWEAAGSDASWACNNSFGGTAIAFLQCAEQ